MPDLRTAADASATLRGPFPEADMGRPLTATEIQKAAANGWTRFRAAQTYETTIHQVRAAEVAHGVSLPRAEVGAAARQDLDVDALLERWLPPEPRSTLAELAAEVGMSASGLYQRFQDHASATGQELDLGPSLRELAYHARQRTELASARLGLPGGRAQAAASWTTVLEEVGLSFNVDDPTRAEQLAMKYAKRWAAAQGLPWGRSQAPKRWSGAQRRRHARELQGHLVQALEEAGAVGAALGEAMQAVSVESLILLEVYAQAGDLDALATETETPERPYHRLRGEAAAHLEQLVQGLAAHFTRSADRWREVVADLLSDRTSDDSGPEGSVAERGAEDSP